jgi:hypothetical protein
MTTKLDRKTAYWTHEACDVAGHLYYFGILGAKGERVRGPYKKQRRVEAIIDVAPDGTLAGVELIDDMPPPPDTHTEEEGS